MGRHESQHGGRENQRDQDLRRALDAIDEAVRQMPPPGPVTLSEEYLRLVKETQDLPRNRSGEDKSWLHSLWRESRRFHEAIERP